MSSLLLFLLLLLLCCRDATAEREIVKLLSGQCGGVIVTPQLYQDRPRIICTETA